MNNARYNFQTYFISYTRIYTLIIAVNHIIFTKEHSIICLIYTILFQGTHIVLTSIIEIIFVIIKHVNCKFYKKNISENTVTKSVITNKIR